MDNCIFCKIRDGKIPSDIVYSDSKVIAFKDIKPAAPVHILIIPREHIESVAALSEENAGVIADIHLAAKKIAHSNNLESFRLINNCGKEAGQTVFHLHYHLIGGKELGTSLL